MGVLGWLYIGLGESDMDVAGEPGLENRYLYRLAK